LANRHYVVIIVVIAYHSWFQRKVIKGINMCFIGTVKRYKHAKVVVCLRHPTWPMLHINDDVVAAIEDGEFSEGSGEGETKLRGCLQ
jgi:hypothetical protein